MRFLTRNKAALLAAAVLLSGLLSGCSLFDAADDSGAESGKNSVTPMIWLTREDRRTSSDSAKSVDLGSAGEELLITDAGDYRLSGEMKGSIHIAAEDQVVHLFLSGVNVKSVTAPAIHVESAGKVIITVEKDSENILFLAR